MRTLARLQARLQSLAAAGQAEDLPGKRASRSLWDLVALAAFLTCSGLLIYGSDRGLDLTDEIFYLLWARDPNAYALTYQPFGYVLHPLYVAVGGNLQAYRLAGFAIVAAAGAFLGCSLSRASRNQPMFALYGAQSALTIFFPWIITPSYNSAANVGALLIIGGLLNIYRLSPAARLVGILAAGAGLTVAAFSKPPLFAIAAAGIAIAAVPASRARLALLGSLGLGMLLVTSFVPAPDLLQLVRRIIATQHVLSLPNTPLGLPVKVVSDWLAVPLELTGAALLGSLTFVLRRFAWAQWLGYSAIALGSWYIGSIVPDAIDGAIPDFLGLAVLTIAFAYGALVEQQRHAVSPAIILLFVAPVAVALGTFNNQWFQLNFSMVFAFLALFAVAALDPSRWRGRTALFLSLAGSTAAMLLAAWAPYSLPAPIFDQQSAVDAPFAGGTVLVDEKTATFVRAARDRARGELLIDLSGTGPGVGVILGARLPVLPWLNPATPTWPDVVWSRLSSSERATAWFIVPLWPQFRSSKPAAWLRMHQSQYCAVLLPAMTFWGDERELQLWRPCRPAQTLAAEHQPVQVSRSSDP